MFPQTLKNSANKGHHSTT